MDSLSTSLLNRLMLTALAGLCLLHCSLPVELVGAEDKGLAGYDWQLPSEKLKAPFNAEQPIYFLARNEKNAAEWEKLPAFWNEVPEKAIDPRTKVEVLRRAVKIKVPLGLSHPPRIPLENPPTVAKWALGKQLYFDDSLSSDRTVSCASCHDPKTGFTTPTRVSSGIHGQLGSLNGPSVINAAYNLLHFWDGRGQSLEHQLQGHVQNPREMFSGEGNAWAEAIARVRSKPDYVKRFQVAFGTQPTRDAIAKAIATYERTILSGNSIQDRAELAMKARAIEEESNNPTIQPKDYEKVLHEARKSRDASSLILLGLDPIVDAAKIPDVAARISAGRALFLGKARCHNCHVGDNFTDNAFHNLGVGVKQGIIPADAVGRFAQLEVGHKNPDMMGAFKTPGLRALSNSAPYMHDGGEDTLEKLIEFYDRGGNPNEFLDPKMRDLDAEQAYAASKRQGSAYKGPQPFLAGVDQKPIVPFKLNLTEQEKKDLVLFLKALQGEPIDPIVADRNRTPPSAAERPG